MIIVILITLLGNIRTMVIAVLQELKYLVGCHSPSAR